MKTSSAGAVLDDGAGSRFRLAGDLMSPSRRHAAAPVPASVLCSGFVARADLLRSRHAGGRRLGRRDAFFPAREVAIRHYGVSRSPLVVGPVERHDVAALAKTRECGAGRVRQPVRGRDDLGKGRSAIALEQTDDPRHFRALAGRCRQGRRHSRRLEALGVVDREGRRVRTGCRIAAVINRNRPQTGGSQFQREGLPRLILTLPDRHPRLSLDLLHEARRQEFRGDLLRRATLQAFRRYKAAIFALRRRAQNNELGVGKFDGHGVDPLAVLGSGHPDPSLTRAPDRSDRQGEGLFAPRLAARGRPHTCSHSKGTQVISEPPTTTEITDSSPLTNGAFRPKAAVRAID